MQRRPFGQTLLAVSLLMLSTAAFAQRESASEQPTDNGLPQIPVVSFITQKFFFTGHFEVKLTREEMRIDHMAIQSNCPMKKRVCHLSLAYATPIMGQTGSGLFELPLLGAERVASEWDRASFGDYIAHFSNTPVYSPDVRLMATLKF